MKLLDTHYAVLDPALRRGLVKALILLRNKGQVRILWSGISCPWSWQSLQDRTDAEAASVLQLATTELHPLFFQLFRCQDKALRQMLFRHIVAGKPEK